ncbi:MAG: DUF3822 family protein [Bacteroidales bacterium]
MQNVFFVDETLDKNLIHTYHLSIQAGLNGLSFCILDPVTNKYIVLSHQNFDENQTVDDITLLMTDFIESSELLNKDYKSTRMIWSSEKSLIVPEELFSKENLKKHFEFVHQLNELDEIHFNKIHNLNAYSIFAVPSLAANLFVRHFKNVRFYNQQQVLIEDIISKSTSSKTRITIYVHNHFFDIAVSELHKLQMINSFKYKKDEDIVYYVLLLMDLYKLNNENCELFAGGFIDKGSTLYSKLHNYVKQIKFCNSPEGYNYSYTFEKIPYQRFSTLFKLAQCE